MWKTPTKALREDLDSALKAIRALEEKQAELERYHKNAMLDYSELYDKVARALSRLAKRHQIDSKEETEAAEGGEEDMIAKARQALISRKLARG